MNIRVTGGDLPEEEIDAYVKRGRAKFGNRLRGLDLLVDGNMVEITYDVPETKFQRIRRITGYLVGTLDRFNNGKRAEEQDRVKHGM